MIIDASAIVAILMHEEDAERFLAIIHDAENPLISAVNYLEVGIRADRTGNVLTSQSVDSLLEMAEITVAAVTPTQARIARRAYAIYGKGFHPAKLNMGDCFAYALAKERGRPLLFKGDDFTKTDIQAAAQ